MKMKVICFLAGVLSAILVFCSINYFTSYEHSIKSMHGTLISYKDVTVSKYLSSDASDYLITGDKKLYFGELPNRENAVEINSPSRAIIYVHPCDENSIIIEYEPHGGISRTYKKSNYGDFNRYLQVLYELTGNEVFNETVIYK